MGGKIEYESPSYWDSFKDSAGDLAKSAYNHITGALSPSNPVASGNTSEKYEGIGGADRAAAIDKAVKDSGG